MSRQNDIMSLLVTIAERGKGQQIVRKYADYGMGCHYQSVGFGTASSELLDMLGFGTTERDILVTPAPNGVIARLIDDIKENGAGIHAKGVLFTIPITAVSSLLAATVTESAEMLPQGGEEYGMEQQTSKHSVVVAVVNHGHTDEVMAAARAAGARGGTVVRARWTGNVSAESFFGITVQEEKELLAILTVHKNRNAIMEAINKDFGLNSPAKGVVISLPVEQSSRLN